MKIGVTGGSGFIGQYIVETLENNSNTELLKIIDLEKPSFSGTFELIRSAGILILSFILLQPTMIMGFLKRNFLM